MKSKIFQTIKVILLGLIFSFGVAYAAVWMGPQGPAPTNNIDTLINVGTNPQAKGLPVISSNILSVNGNLGVAGDVIATGNGTFNKLQGDNTNPKNVCSGKNGKLVICTTPPPPVSANCIDPNSSTYNQAGPCGPCNAGYVLTNGLCTAVPPAPTISASITETKDSGNGKCGPDGFILTASAKNAVGPVSYSWSISLVKGTGISFSGWESINGSTSTSVGGSIDVRYVIEPPIQTYTLDQWKITKDSKGTSTATKTITERATIFTSSTELVAVCKQ